MPKPLAHHSLYIPKEMRPLFDDIKEGAEEINKKFDNIVWVALQVFWPEIKKQMKTKRIVKIQGKEIIL